jgi:hypothetical protein
MNQKNKGINSKLNTNISLNTNEVAKSEQNNILKYIKLQSIAQVVDGSLKD